MAYETSCLKKSLFGISVVYLIFGVIVLIFGCHYTLKSINEGVNVIREIEDEKTATHVLEAEMYIGSMFLTGACLLILTATVICLGILAIVGTWKQNLCVLKMAAIFLLICAAAQLLFGLIFLVGARADDEILNEVKKALDLLKEDDHGEEGMNYIMKEHNCSIEDVIGLGTEPCENVLVDKVVYYTIVGSALALVGGFINIAIATLALLHVKAVNRERRRPYTT